MHYKNYALVLLLSSAVVSLQGMEELMEVSGDRESYEALLKACEEGNVQDFEDLLSAGAPVEITDEYPYSGQLLRTAVVKANWAGGLKILQIILSRPDKNRLINKSDVGGKTALQLAQMKRDYIDEAIKLLREHGEDQELRYVVDSNNNDQPQN